MATVLTDPYEVAKLAALGLTPAQVRDRGLFDEPAQKEIDIDSFPAFPAEEDGMEWLFR